MRILCACCPGRMRRRYQPAFRCKPSQVSIKYLYSLYEFRCVCCNNLCIVRLQCFPKSLPRKIARCQLPQVVTKSRSPALSRRMQWPVNLYLYSTQCEVGAPLPTCTEKEEARLFWIQPGPRLLLCIRRNPEESFCLHFIRSTQIHSSVRICNLSHDRDGASQELSFLFKRG